MLSILGLLLSFVILLDAQPYRTRDFNIDWLIANAVYHSWPWEKVNVKVKLIGTPRYSPYPPAGWSPPYQTHQVKAPWKPASPLHGASFHSANKIKPITHNVNSVPGIYQCRDGNTFYKVGDKWTPEGGCGRMTCVAGGKTSMLGCPSVETSDGSCLLTAEDLRKPWPLCCPQLKCLSEQ